MMPPMMPPMTPPLGGGRGNGNGERERTTWLSEDESVWGTASTAGIGVIGRLDDEDDADERAEIRTHVLATSPKARAEAARRAGADNTADATG
jgi:hypothetical protein